MNSDDTNYEKWKPEDFEALPKLDRYDEVNGYYGEIDCIVLIPTKKFHDSGFRIMDIAIIKDGKPIGRYADRTDTVQLNCHNNTPYAWHVDCLPISGFMRLWPAEHTCKILSPFSTFGIQTSQQYKNIF